jgi:predicted ABC-type ATPase
MEDRYLKWAKFNRKRIVKAYLTRFEYPSSEHPSIIFMAGLPGAGKTEFASRLLPQLDNKMLHIDLDEIAENIKEYNPKIAHLFRPGANIILERLYDQSIKKRIDILMDGTLGHDKALENIERAILHYNYTARIYFILQDPIKAWEVTQLREKVEFRSIDAEGFAISYYKMLDNLNKLQQKFGDKISISVVIKRPNNSFKEINDNVSNISYYTDPTLTYNELLAKIK